MKNRIQCLKGKNCVREQNQRMYLINHSDTIQEPYVSKDNHTIETNPVCVIIDSMNLQVNASYTPIITSKKNNDVCVTKNDIKSYSDDEDMLIDYEASDNDENSFREVVDKINKDINICSISGAKNHNLLNLAPNLLKEGKISSLDTPCEANIGPMQLQKSQLFLKKWNLCSENKETCDQSQVCEESEEREEKKENNEWK